MHIKYKCIIKYKTLCDYMICGRIPDLWLNDIMAFSNINISVDKSQFRSILTFNIPFVLKIKYYIKDQRSKYSN